eukprot:jgi/Chlat1/4565/Chrsp29S04597
MGVMAGVGMGIGVGAGGVCLLTRRPAAAAAAASAWLTTLKPAAGRSHAAAAVRLGSLSSSDALGRVRADMFDALSDRLGEAWKKLSGADKLDQDNIKEPMKEIRRALLEADVSLPVVRRFIKRVEDKAVGVSVLKGVKPDQQLVKVVYDELASLMGGEQRGLEFSKKGPTVILMAGLQGVGKTTACGKLALYLQQKQGKSVAMVAADVYRPAAIDQLVTLGKQVGVPVFEFGADVDPVTIAKRGVEEGTKAGADVVNKQMMAELTNIRKAVKPTETLLVVDAMTGQEAAALVAAFNSEVELTGAILTKLDGDARGGAALSINEVSGKPIKFVGVGEKLTALEPFYPDRMAQRILGMGDILSLVEKAQDSVDEESAKRLNEKILEAKFDFNDFLQQMGMLKKMGNMSGFMKMVPGMNKMIPQGQLKEAEKSIGVMEVMISSMTKAERADPNVVQTLLAQFGQLRSQMQSMSKMMMAGGPGQVPGAGSMPSMDEILTGNVRKAAPGKAKRKKSRQLEEAGARPKGFGGGGGFGKK